MFAGMFQSYTAAGFAWPKRASRSYLRCRKNMGCHFGRGRAIAARLDLRSRQTERRSDPIDWLRLIGAGGVADNNIRTIQPCMVARAHAACGRVAEAQNAISQALDSVSKTNQRWDEAEIHRTAGELAASLSSLRFRNGRIAISTEPRHSPPTRARSSFELLPRRVLPGCGATRVDGKKRANCSRQFSTGSPRVSTCPT